MLHRDGYLVYTVVGTSMLPLLKQRHDIVEIRSGSGERFKKYDVVLYHSADRYVLHRILKVRPHDYVIAGDHNTFLEYGITDEQILGKMTRVIRDGEDLPLDGLRYRIYVHLWCDFYPVRAFILRAKALLRRGMRKAKRMLPGKGRR